MEALVSCAAPVHIRELLPGDVEAYLEGFRRLSRRSILQRFNAPIRELTAAQVRYLTEVDQRDHYACCAYVVVGHRQHGVGVGRFVRIAGQPRTAEFAVTVTDDYQRHGFGTTLLGHLERSARERGIGTLLGYVRADNAPMFSLLRGRRYEARREPGDLVRVELPVARGR